MEFKFGALEDIEAKLDRIFSEAGDDLDLTKCKDLYGDRLDRVAQLKKINDQREELLTVKRAAERGYGHESGADQGGHKTNRYDGGIFGEASGPSTPPQSPACCQTTQPRLRSSSSSMARWTSARWRLVG